MIERKIYREREREWKKERKKRDIYRERNRAREREKRKIYRDSLST